MDQSTSLIRSFQKNLLNSKQTWVMYQEIVNNSRRHNPVRNQMYRYTGITKSNKLLITVTFPSKEQEQNIFVISDTVIKLPQVTTAKYKKNKN